MRSVAVFLLAAATLAGALPAAAQTRAARPRIGFRAYGIVEGESIAAAKTFTAVLDSKDATVSLAGAGGEVTNLWKGLFARVAVTHASVKGSRVYIDASGGIHPLPVPMTIEITPVEIGAGWRFGRPRPNAKLTVTPYVGAAILSQAYKETSSFASSDENTDTSDAGQAIFGGVEIGIRLFKLGVEAKYRSVDVASTLGSTGVLQAMKEGNLGGTVFRLSFGVGF